MIELKFTAEKSDGQKVGGVISADNYSSGKHKANIIAVQNNIKIRTIEKKSTFLYKVKRGNEKPIRGEKKAFNKEEVIEALALLGYQIISVNKKIVDIKRKPSKTDILMFVKVAADMLEEKMSYGEILSFIIKVTSFKPFE